MPDYRVPSTHFSSAGLQLLALPGQVALPFPRDLLASAPWIFVVYMAFQAHWPPLAIIVLIGMLIPMVVLTTQYRRV
jgi:hypothetical protein